MNHEPNQPDPIETDIARALAALNSAAPPEGMEARITQRLAAHAPADGVPHSRAALSRVSGLIATLLPSAPWLRGAITGAAVASLLFGGLFFATRGPRAAPLASDAGVPHSSQLHRDEWDEKSSPNNSPTPVALRSGDQCANRDRERRVPHPDSAWVGNVATARVPHSSHALGAPFMRGRQNAHEWESADEPHLIPASFAPSKPAPPIPLTAQERALIQLAGNPAALAALTHTADRKSDAQREADFQKFFAPSPELAAIDQAQDEALGITTTPPAPPPPTEVRN